MEYIWKKSEKYQQRMSVVDDLVMHVVTTADDYNSFRRCPGMHKILATNTACYATISICIILGRPYTSKFEQKSGQIPQASFACRSTLFITCFFATATIRLSALSFNWERPQQLWADLCLGVDFICAYLSCYSPCFFKRLQLPKDCSFQKGYWRQLCYRAM